MENLTGKRFIASYSGGKDSILSIYKAKKAGLLPVELVTTYNTDMKRSWFHGIPKNILSKVSESLDVPVRLIMTSGDEYEKNFEKALMELKNQGAEVCVFGDIDIEGHLEWCIKRCENTGLIPCFPLWKNDRKKVVFNFVEAGFSAMITIVNTSLIPEKFLGQILTKELLGEIEKTGADICGENGEYHTFVFDGPLFAKKLDIGTGEKVRQGKYLVLPIK